jgi:DNA-binding transcriptional LysR family regulator
LGTDHGHLTSATQLYELACLVAVIDERHVERAAQRLPVAPDAVRRAVGAVEHRVGVPLAALDHGAVAPTDAGLELAKAARAALGLVFGGVGLARPHHAGLSIGCLPELRLQRLQALVGAVSLRLPRAAVEIVHRRSAGQLAALRAGALALGVVHGAEHEGVATEPLFDGEALAAILALHHPLAGEDMLAPEDLAGETLLCVPRWADGALHDELTAAYEEAGYGFRARRELRGADVRDLLFAVASGWGITLAPAAVVTAGGEYSDLVVTRPLEGAPTSPGSFLAWRDERGEPPLDARELARALRRTSCD